MPEDFIDFFSRLDSWLDRHFPDEAKGWDMATDEPRDMALWIAREHLGIKHVPGDRPLTPAGHNKKYKTFIREYFPKMSIRLQIEFEQNFGGDWGI